MGYKNVPFGTPERFNVVIEIPQGSEVKYEYDEDLDVIKADWIFTDGFKFPFDYGYIPQTRGGDGDLLDAFVLGSRSIAPGTVVECRALGMIELVDRGEKDDKILAVPVIDPVALSYAKLHNLPFDYRKIFGDFFAELCIQKKKVMEIKSYKESEDALKAIETGHAKFSGNYK